MHPVSMDLRPWLIHAVLSALNTITSQRLMPPQLEWLIHAVLSALNTATSKLTLRLVIGSVRTTRDTPKGVDYEQHANTVLNFRII